MPHHLEADPVEVLKRGFDQAVPAFVFGQRGFRFSDGNTKHRNGPDECE